MTIRSTPPLGDTDISTEFPDSGSNYFQFDRYLRGVAQGPVPASVTKIPAAFPLAFDDFLGATKGEPGEKRFDVPGTYQFVVPTYGRLRVRMSGGGGGGGSSCWDGGSFVGAGQPGSAGGDSSVLSLKAGGGGGGNGPNGARYPAQVSVGAPGQPGPAVGGTTNTAGGGRAGGIGGNFFNVPNSLGGTGGSGGFVDHEYVAAEPGSPAFGITVTVVVAAGGAGGPFPGSAGTAGENGYVHFSWT